MHMTVESSGQDNVYVRSVKGITSSEPIYNKGIVEEMLEV